MEAMSDLLSSLDLDAFVNAYDWVWPVFEIFHFLGMALLFGTVGMLDLRLLGLGRGIPVERLQRFIPIGILGFVLNASTGFVFVAGNPIGGPMVYLDNLAFQIKLVLILVAGLNLLAFHWTGLSRAADALAPSGDAAPAAKLVAAVSLVLWIGVIVFGRLIMYNDTLLLALGL